MPDQTETDAIIERHRQVVEVTIRRQIVNVFRLASAYSEGQLQSELASRHVSIDEFWRHYGSLGIKRARITDTTGWHWWMYYIPDNWNPKENP